jgi:hypothetical protein
MSWVSSNVRGNIGLRKKSRSDKKETPQGLKPDVFSILYGPTKSRALIQNKSFSAACKAVPLVERRFPSS